MKISAVCPHVRTFCFRMLETRNPCSNKEKDGKHN